MAKASTGILLLNLGTPDSPSTKDVATYLREFLMDGRVIDIPYLQRWALVNLIIAPFRAPQSAKGYQQLWTPDGSPLKIYGFQVTKLLQKSLGEQYQVVLGMRYQNPSLKSALDQFKNQGLKEIIVIPLYPQYASASTGSTHEKLMDEIKSWEVIPTLTMISQFFNHPLFIKAFVDLGKKYMAQANYDHFLFSYHGLPERQILKASCDDYCRLGDCCKTYHNKNRYCYRAQCFATTRLLTQALGISENQYTLCFQSRLGKDPWIKPYTDHVIGDLIKNGKKNVLVFSPAFIADCLETTVEIGIEYRHIFQKLGGERWQLVESLNNSPQWIECLKQIVLENSKNLC
jgi:ferrochelatase